MTKAAVDFYGDGNEVWVWIAPPFVLFSAFSGVVCMWRSVSCSGGFGEWVGDTDVDVIGSRFVVAHYVELCLFVVWCAYVAIEFGDEDL